MFVPFAKMDRKPMGSVVAAVAGTLTNTIGVLGLALYRGFLPDWRVAGMIVERSGIELFAAFPLTTGVICITIFLRVLRRFGGEPKASKA